MKTFELFTHNDPYFSYKLQKKHGYLAYHQYGDRDCEATFANELINIEFDTNAIEQVNLQKFTLNINDASTQYLSTHHLKVFYKFLSSTFTGKFDEINLPKKVDLSIYNSNYFLLLKGLDETTFNGIQLLVTDNFIEYNKNYRLTYELPNTNEICIASSNVTLDEFLRYCYIIIFFTTQHLNIRKNDDSLIHKVIRYIYSLNINKLSKSSLLFTVFGTISTNELNTHLYNIYGKKK